MSAALRRSLSALEVPNYRRWFAGQLVSISGNWMQMVAEVWLVLSLTGSAVAVGLTTALQFLPILVVGAWGGLIADRMPKRRLLIVTQAMLVVPALAMFGLAASGIAEAWMVLALVLVRGAILAVDNPARQSFVIEVVGPDRVVNAVGLQSVMIHSSRIAGPALAGLLIVTVGVASCFLLNALSFAAMIIALRSLNTSQLRPPKPAEREPGAIRSGLRYVARSPQLAVPLGMMALVGTLSFNFPVILPLLAKVTFDGGAGDYTLLAVSMGIGGVIGALMTGARGKVSERLLVGSSLGIGIVALVAAMAPSLITAAATLAVLAAFSVTFAAGVNSTLQISAEPSLRGRVMALYSVVFLGSSAIGAPAIGWISGAIDPRAGLVVAAIGALAAALAGHLRFRTDGFAPGPAVASH